jgi:hypothetical protein
MEIDEIEVAQRGTGNAFVDFRISEHGILEIQNVVFVGSTSLHAGAEKGTRIVGFKIAKVESAKTDVSF